MKFVTFWKPRAEANIFEIISALIAGFIIVAIVHTVQIDDPDVSDFPKTVQHIYKRYRGEHKPTDFPTEKNVFPDTYHEYRDSTLYQDVELLRWRWDQNYTANKYKDLLMTFSDIRAMNASSREQMITELSKIIDKKYNGQITRPLVAALVLARKK